MNRHFVIQLSSNCRTDAV